VFQVLPLPLVTGQVSSRLSAGFVLLRFARRGWSMHQLLTRHPSQSTSLYTVRPEFASNLPVCDALVLAIIVYSALQGVSN
jgi:hypothetical protein